ncbi:hypothetical protein ACOSQ4_032942 [Xanthoceras sorbifolium]
MASCAQGLDSLFSPPIAEALAILHGLNLAIDTGLLPICVESDAEVILVEMGDVESLAFVYWKANQVVHHLTKFGSVVQWAASFMGDFVVEQPVKVGGLRCKDIKWKPPNSVVHPLAKFGLTFINEFVWLEDCQFCVVPLVLNDCSG